ncbi:MAG TPA: hypothetical protein V6D09_04510 [Leptolyngbyaceae cyanobacterium]|jgi:hypothetical protein
MNSSTLRQIWSVIEETQSSLLLRLSDTELVKQLLSQLESRNSLSNEEMIAVSGYIHSRTSLIRDLALAR